MKTFTALAILGATASTLEIKAGAQQNISLLPSLKQCLKWDEEITISCHAMTNDYLIQLADDLVGTDGEIADWVSLEKFQQDRFLCESSIFDTCGNQKPSDREDCVIYQMNWTQEETYNNGGIINWCDFAEIPLTPEEQCRSSGEGYYWEDS